MAMHEDYADEAGMMKCMFNVHSRVVACELLNAADRKEFIDIIVSNSTYCAADLSRDGDEEKATRVVSGFGTKLKHAGL